MGMKLNFKLEIFGFLVQKHPRGEAFFSRLKKVEIFLQNEKKRKSFYNLQRLKKVGIFLQNEKKRKSFYNLSANPQPSSHPPF